MIALNSRLKLIADYIKTGQTMADIGTDHGFLPMYLRENGICPKVVMTDISAASLQKAVRLFEKYEDKSGACFRVGDGLAPIDAHEVDVIVMAGMGGILMADMLGRDMNKTLSFKSYILQPRNKSAKLRYWLVEAGFFIVSENLAREGKFICEIMLVKPPETIKKVPSLSDYNDDIRYEMPCNLSSSVNKLFIEHINKKINIEKKILEQMRGGNTRYKDKMEKTASRIKFMEGVLEDAYA